MKKKILLVLCIALISCFVSSANLWAADTVIHKHSHMWEDFDRPIGQDTVNFSVFQSPMVEVYGSFQKYSIDENSYKGKFPDKQGLSDIRLGSLTKKRLRQEPFIIKYNDSYAFLSVGGEKYGMPKIDSHIVKANIISFGFGSSTGYGYRLGDKSDFVFYHSSGLSWSRLDFNKPIPKTHADSVFDYSAIDVYGRNIRFGQYYDAGIRFQPISLISLKFAYEQSIVYPRVLFWKWLGSTMIEGLAQGLVDNFIDHVYKASPVAGPIVYFVLKNGISYAAHHLKKEDMNWPFDTVSPFMIDSWKLGISLHF